MSASLFENIKAYVSLTEADAKALGELRDPLTPYFGKIVKQFYEVLLKHDQTRAVLEKNHVDLDRLQQTFQSWLAGLFSGRYDENYYENRCKIGRMHVRVDLPSIYMFTAMNVVRLALEDQIRHLGLQDSHHKITALHKILDLDLAIMNEIYREDMVRHVKAIEQSHYQQKLSESEHMASIGQLAASLAHEIKNPLAGISGAIQILGSTLEEGHPHKEVIAEVLRQIDRLDAAVKDLLIYARPKPPERVRINLSHLLDRAMLLLHEEPAFRKVEVVCQGLDLEYIVKVDEMQFQQVISNLMLNAADACERGGKVICRIERHDSVIQVIIEDDGVGIPPESLSRVFEPFYTTKSKGTGLGLPICKRIVEGHGGRLDIHSEVGVGTQVSVEIPFQK